MIIPGKKPGQPDTTMIIENEETKERRVIDLGTPAATFAASSTISTYKLSPMVTIIDTWPIVYIISNNNYQTVLSMVKDDIKKPRPYNYETQG